MKIAATGLEGLLGSRIRALLEKDFEFISLPQSSLDITDAQNVAKVISTTEFDIFLHLAAYTNVDGAEENRDLAHNVNVKGTQYLYDNVTAKGKHMIFFSTGFVFDGTNPPYDEDSAPHPLGWYAQNKYDAEEYVKEKALIVRPDYPYGNIVAYKKDIVHSILDLLKAGTPLKGITDQWLTPTYIDDIAMALAHLFNNFAPGVVHLVGADSLTGMELITTIGEVFELDTSHVTPITYAEFYQGKAARPQNARIISKKNTFHPMKTFRQGLMELKARGLYS